MSDVYLNVMGIVSALGNGHEETLINLAAGNTKGVKLLRGVLADGNDMEFGSYSGLIKEIPEEFTIFSSRNLQLAFTALEQIQQEVEASIELYGNDRIAVVIGTSTSGIEEGEKALHNLNTEDKFPQEFNFLQQEMGSTSEFIARLYGIRGPALTISTACSSSAKAFGVAKRLLDQDICDAVIVGGVDSFCQLTANGFSSLSALHNGSGCLPFSKNRSGTVLGEASTLFLMSREIKGCLLASIGESTDAYTMTSPDPTGAGAIDAIKVALSDAGLSPQDIDYVNLHGTGTRQNDFMEAKAIHEVFGRLKPSLSSTKPLSGHTLGAAGALEVGFCWLSLSSYLLPVHVWDEIIDPDIPLTLFVKRGDTLPGNGMNWCMSNSYAFGGSNACVILGRVN